MTSATEVVIGVRSGLGGFGAGTSGGDVGDMQVGGVGDTSVAGVDDVLVVGVGRPIGDLGVVSELHTAVPPSTVGLLRFSAGQLAEWPRRRRVSSSPVNVVTKAMRSGVRKRTVGKLEPFDEHSMQVTVPVPRFHERETSRDRPPSCVPVNR